MINARELRIGNKYYYLSSNGRKQINTMSGFGLYCLEREDMDSFFMKEEDIEPIPLTPEILVKSGFKIETQNTSNSTSMKYFIIGKFFICPIQVGSDGFYYNNIKIEYLHQLQNLYYALTGGKELVIEL